MRSIDLWISASLAVLWGSVFLIPVSDDGEAIRKGFCLAVIALFAGVSSAVSSLRMWFRGRRETALLCAVGLLPGMVMGAAIARILAVSR